MSALMALTPPACSLLASGRQSHLEKSSTPALIRFAASVSPGLNAVLSSAFAAAQLT